MASKNQTAKTTDRVINKETGEVVSYHASHRAAMVECLRQYKLGKSVRHDSLTRDGQWWSAGYGIVA